MQHQVRQLAALFVCHITLTLQALAATPALPPPWQQTNIGAALVGNASEGSGVLSITGSGADIWNRADEFYFAYQNLNGDFEISTQVLSQDYTDAWAKAGLMARESAAAGSRHAYVAVTPRSGVAFQARPTEGAQSVHVAGSLSRAPRWLRLSRKGNTLSGYESADGLSWTAVSSFELSMPSTLLVGLAVTSHNAGKLSLARFASVSVKVASAPQPQPPLPPPPSSGVSAIDCRHFGSGTDYQVGDGKSYPNLGSVPFESLRAGDTVRVFWRAQPYREKILLRGSGTAEQPIRLCGVPGPNGEKPVIDGQDATTRAQLAFPYSGTQDRGLLVLSRASSDVWAHKPKHIVIEGLEFRNAAKPHGFRAGNGAQRFYTDNAAAIFVERGERVTIRGCVITASGNGLFVASGGEEAMLSREILVEGNHIYGNGNVGRDKEHNVYTEAAGITFQFNRLGSTRAGSGGSNLKDRSAGTVIRYNWIEGGAYTLDLVEAQGGAPLLVSDPRYRKTFVYGNVLRKNTPVASNMIHYGGDSGVTSNYRKGTLHVYNNTILFEVTQAQLWNTYLFRIETNEEAVDFRNNVVHRSADSHLHLMNRQGVLTIGTNWITPGWLPMRSDNSVPIVYGAANVIGGADPGFVNAAGASYYLKAASPLRSLADELHPDARAHHAPNWEFSPDLRGVARSNDGDGDLGALEGR